MLVQQRPAALRLITQHDHALLSGSLAAAWRDPEGQPLSIEVVVACALHDVPWRRADRLPRLERDTGAPLDFAHHPAERKARFVRGGLARLERLERGRVAALVRAHHEALADARPPLGDARWLRFFDVLSLFLCLTPPGSSADGHPAWLEDRIRRPDGEGDLALAWRSEDELAVTPFPFDPGPLLLRVPFRDLPPGPYPRQRSLAAAWRAARVEAWSLRLVPGGAAAHGA